MQNCVIQETSILKNSQPFILLSDGKAELRNTTISDDLSMHGSSACGNTMSAQHEITGTPEGAIPVGLKLGNCAQVTVDRSRLACAVTSSTARNFLIYTSSTSFDPYNTSRSLAGLGSRGLLQSDVCTSEQCEENLCLQGPCSPAPCRSRLHAPRTPVAPSVGRQAKVSSSKNNVRA